MLDFDWNIRIRFTFELKSDFPVFPRKTGKNRKPVILPDLSCLFEIRHENAAGRVGFKPLLRFTGIELQIPVKNLKMSILMNSRY